MKYIGAYLLAVLGGNATPSAADVKAIITSVGIEVDEARLKAVISELEGKDVNELIEAGTKKLAKMGGGGAPAAAGGAAASQDAAPVEEEVVEEEEADIGGATDMFGGGGSDY